MRFKLLTAHYLPGDRLVLEGMEIGDGTQFPVDFKAYPPTHEMEGMDPPSKAAVALAMDRFIKSNPIDTIPKTMGES